MTEYPRVTEILKCFTKFDQVPKDILENAAERGTRVHNLCAGIANGEWIPEAMIPEELRGYVNSFKQWSEAQVTKFIVIEKRFKDDNLIFSGQLDLVILGSDNELYLVDLKTSARSYKTYPVQMGAYEHLLNIHQIKVKGAMLVYLKKDGEFPDIDFFEDLTEERNTFFAALTCWNYFNKKGTRRVRRKLTENCT